MIKLISNTAAVLLSTFVIAQTKTTTTTADKGFFSAGINPTYPFFGGYGVKVFYNLPKRWSIGVASEGSFVTPTFAAASFLIMQKI
jgi:hypothetical protein